MDEESNQNNEITKNSGTIEPTPQVSPSASRYIRALPQVWKEKIQSWGEKLSSFKTNAPAKFNRAHLEETIRNFDPQATLEWITKAVQKQKAGLYGTIAVIVLSTFFLADLFVLIGENYIPAPPIYRSRSLTDRTSQIKTFNDYSPIFSRNLFNSRGLIPGEEASTGSGSNLDAPAVKTTLPLNLIGILAMEDERRSVATFEDKGAAGKVYAVQQEDEIPGKMRILQVEPTRVTFVNLASNRKEYIDLPEDTQAKNPRVILGQVPRNTSGSGIEQVNTNQFSVSRSEVDKTLSDLNNVLTQARAVPNFENGAPAGYKLFQIVPGSIYDKLGLKNGDVIVGLNGQPINDPGKAFEMLSELKTSSHMELQVKRDGKQSTNSYDIR